MKQHGSKITGIALAVTVIAVLLGFLLRGVLFTRDEAAAETPETETGQSQNTDSADRQEGSVRAALKTWDVYRLDDLDFVFVIAVVSVDNPEKTVTLDHFVTDEGIPLDSLSPYTEKLEEHSYYLGRRNVMFSLVPAEQSYDAALFIPLKDASKQTLTVSCDLKTVEDMHIDLAKNVITDGSSLYVSGTEGEVISDETTFRMIVNKALDLSGEMFFMVDAEGSRMQYTVPAANRVYGFEIVAASLDSESVVITDAEFIPDGYEEGFHAMDGSVRAMKETNMIGRSILTEDSGFLFFEVYGPEYSPVTYHGVLFLFLEGKDEPVSIQVDLN